MNFISWKTVVEHNSKMILSSFLNSFYSCFLQIKKLLYSKRKFSFNMILWTYNLYILIPPLACLQKKRSLYCCHTINIPRTIQIHVILSHPWVAWDWYVTQLKPDGPIINDQCNCLLFQGMWNFQLPCINY
jgi:hypothetical protein